MSHIIAGICCYLIGFGFLILLILPEQQTGMRFSAPDTPYFVLIMFCLEWILAGAWLTQIHRLWVRRIPNVPINWDHFWPAVIMTTAPIMGMAAAIGEPETRVEGIPLFVPLAAFLAFMFAGLWVFNHAVIVRRDGDNSEGLVNRILVALLLTFFALAVAGVAVSPAVGESQSTVSVPFLSFSQGEPSIVGNLIATPGALLLIALAVALWLRLVRSVWKQRRARLDASSPSGN
jgi:hypothetical protein